MPILFRSISRLTESFSRLGDLKSASLYALSLFAVNAATVICGFLIYAWIGPDEMSIWQILVIFQTYAGLLNFGVLNGMNRELPFAIGAGDHSTARLYAGTVRVFVILLGSISITITIAAVFVPWPDSRWYWAVGATGAIISCRFYYQYLTGLFRAYNQFSRLSVIQFCDAALRLITLVLVAFGGFAAYCARAALLVVAATAISHFWKPKQFPIKFSFAAMRPLLKTGFPIFLLSYCFGIALTLPRIVLVSFGSIGDLGIYAPVVTMLTAVSALFMALQSYVYPRASALLGANQNSASGLWKSILSVHIVTVLLGLPIVLVGYPLIPILVESFIPKYSASIEALQVGLFAVVFMGYRIGAGGLFAAKAWSWAILFVASAVVLLGSLPILFTEWFDPLLAITYGQVVAAVLLFLVSLFTNWAALRTKEVEFAAPTIG